MRFRHSFSVCTILCACLLAGPCYSFQESGSCRFGDSCRFSHGAGASQG